MADKGVQDLRAMVREVLSEVLPEAVRTARQGARPARAPSAPSSLRSALAGRQDGTASVRIGDSDELQAFARDLMALAGEEAFRRAVADNRIRFTLAPAGAQSPAPGSPTAPLDGLAVDEGVINERRIAEIAKTHARLWVSDRVVLTPLARDKARACGLEIVRNKP